MSEHLEKLAMNAMTRHHLAKHLSHITSSFKNVNGISLENFLNHYRASVRARLTESMQKRIPALRKLPK
jgi:hypothetical protein